jgi:DMSO reductase anchor subunit
VKPAFSVLFFTVLSGAGMGALAIIALFDIVTASTLAPVAPSAPWLRATLVAILLVVVGLCSSTLHLANPKNAWRAASRWRTSWLSREAILSGALLAVASAYVLAWWSPAPVALRVVLAVLSLLLAWSTLYCTAMIYASLKPIRQWHTRRVPLTYLLLGHASGAMVVIAVLRGHGVVATVLAAAALVLLAVAAFSKLEYWRFIASGERALTIEQAVGVAHGVRPPPVPGRAGAQSVMAARLLDTGHSRDTFLTREFMAKFTRRRRMITQGVMWVLGFAVPAAWLAWGAAQWQGAVLATLACIVGLLAERWLFFADARHTVRLFHGDRTT